jgi:hypothetical protein
VLRESLPSPNHVKRKLVSLDQSAQCNLCELAELPFFHETENIEFLRTLQDLLEALYHKHLSADFTSPLYQTVASFRDEENVSRLPKRMYNITESHAAEIELVKTEFPRKLESHQKFPPILYSILGLIALVLFSGLWKSASVHAPHRWAEPSRLLRPSKSIEL